MKSFSDIFLVGYIALLLLSPMHSYASTNNLDDCLKNAVPALSMAPDISIASQSETETNARLEILETEIAPRCQFDALLNLSMTRKEFWPLFNTFEGPLPQWLLKTAEQKGMTQLFSRFPKLRVLVSAHSIWSLLNDNKLSLLTNLTKFDVGSMYSRYTSVGLAPLTRLMELQLSFLSDSHGRGLSDNAILRMTNLTALGLSRNEKVITGAALTALKALRRLRFWH